MISYVALALSAVAACFSAISLGAHWFRAKEHPDVTRVRLDLTDLHDKFDHYVRRERTRKLREAHEPAEAEAPTAALPADLAQAKAALRMQVFGRRA